MLRIKAQTAVNYDAKIYLMADLDRQCPVCGRYPRVTIVVSNPELYSNQAPGQRFELMRHHWLHAKAQMAALLPCDHGTVARAQARHRRRHYRYWR